MAVVYLAEDVKHNRKVAVKVLRPELAASIGAERFLREIAVTAKLSHPHILPLLDSGQAGTFLYYVMPHIEGQSLREKLDREKQLTFDDAVTISRQIASALDYAHRQGVIHRDIKPENVLIHEDEAMVADFGIALAISEAGGERLTGTGLSIGTPAYMSPEQATGSPEIDARSDIFSLACMSYEMLAGEPPHTGPSAHAVLARKLGERPPSLTVIRGSVDPALDAVFRKALAPVPADRYGTAAAFVDALAAPGGGDWPSGHREMVTARRRVTGRTLALVGLAVAVVATLSVAALRRGPVDRSGTPMLVVLPFDHIGPSEDEYLAAGITDEITSRLARVSSLGVISRTSAISYNRTDKAIKQIGDELVVEYVLTGTVRTERHPDGTGSLRVVPHLIRVSGDREIWSTPFDATIVPGQMIATQATIAEGVADAMDVTLLPPERIALREGRTDNAGAYDYFLRGTVFSARPFVEDATRRAIEMYEKAVTLDPQFGLAQARLAEALSQYYFFFDRSSARRERARAAVERAVAIDSVSVAARLASGYFRNWVLLDYEGALREFEAVRRSQPNNSQLLYLMGAALRRAGRWDEALEMYTRAFELSPREQTYALDLGSTYLVLHRFEESERFLKRALVLAPDWAPPYAVMGHLYLSWRGDLDEVRQVLREAALRAGWDPLMTTMVRFRYLLTAVNGALQDSLSGLSLDRLSIDSAAYYLSKAEWHSGRGRSDVALVYYDSARTVSEARVRARPDEAPFRADLGVAYAGLGRRTDAIREGLKATQLVTVERDAYFGQLYLGWLTQIYVMVGDYEAAITTVRDRLRTRSAVTVDMLRGDPHFDPLRAFPGFQQLLR